jgi:hypothetical protein
MVPIDSRLDRRKDDELRAANAWLVKTPWLKAATRLLP